MRLKKIMQELKTALDTEPGQKKRSEKIHKLVDELGKKKKKYESKAKNVDGERKKLGQKIEACDVELAKGRKALKPESAKPASVAKSAKPVGKDKNKSASEDGAKSESNVPKPEGAARTLRH
ncbi:MAG: hypothetical protein H6876_07620 [Hyphomicrobiaceae bacterium]|nr:hypothetical protein [Hyphomicrobiaceae bacterium]